MTVLPSAVVHAAPVQAATVQTRSSDEAPAAALAKAPGERVDPQNPTIAGSPHASVPRNSTPNTPSTTTMHAPDTTVDCGTTVSKSKSFNQNSSTAMMTVTGSDPDGGDLTMTFSLYNRSKTRVSSLSVGPIAASGSDGVLFSTRIPSTWSDGDYFWTAQLSDGSKSSDPSGRCYITLDSVAPLQPKVTSTSFDQGTLYPWDTASGSFTMAAAGASAFQYSWNGGSNTTTVPVNSRSGGVPAWTGVVPLTFSGMGSLTVTAVDLAGNGSPQSEAFVVKKGSEPVGAISGTVTDAGGTPQGLANVQVQVSSSSSGASGYASTSGDGSYTVNGLKAANDYQVCFSALGATGGSSDESGYVDQCYDNQPISGTPTPVSVAVSATTSDIDAALVGNETTPGAVLDVTAIPASTSIALSWTNPVEASLTGVMIRRAVGATPPSSADAGTLVTDIKPPATSFTDDGLTPGTQYSYALFAHNGTPSFATAATVTSTTTAVGPGAISGTVTDAGGTHQGLANIQVTVYSSTGDNSSATTADDGTYNVTGLSAGQYTLWFDGSIATGGSSDATGYLPESYDNQPLSDPPTPVAVTEGAITSGVNAALAAGGAVSGTVTAAGGAHQGLANVQVQVIPGSGGPGGFTRTGVDGSYTAKGIPAGTDFTVCFDAADVMGSGGYFDECWQNQPTSGTPTPVTIALGATTTDINGTLAAAGGISGRVTQAGAGPQGLANVDVYVYSSSNGAYETATTAADGSYAVAGIPPATDYQVCFFASSVTGGSSDALGYVDQCWQNQSTSGTSTPVSVALGATTSDISAALVGAGAISGTVRDTGGTPQGLTNVFVSVSSPSNGAYEFATTAADGSYTVTGLEAATDYRVCFSASAATGGSSDATGYLDQCYDNQPISGTPTPVSVALGATTSNINAALVGGGAISGTVTDADGVPHGLANVQVQVFAPSSQSYWYATSAADGSYSVPGLEAAAEYQVCFWASGATGGSSDATGYDDQCYDAQPMSGTPTLVAVTAGVTTSDINAVLVGAAAMRSTPRHLSPATERVAVSH